MLLKNDINDLKDQIKDRDEEIKMLRTDNENLTMRYAMKLSEKTMFENDNKRLRENNESLSSIITMFKSYGTDGCRQCETGRFSMFTSSDRLCYPCAEAREALGEK